MTEFNLYFAQSDTLRTLLAIRLDFFFSLSNYPLVCSPVSNYNYSLVYEFYEALTLTSLTLSMLQLFIASLILILTTRGCCPAVLQGNALDKTYGICLLLQLICSLQGVWMTSEVASGTQMLSWQSPQIPEFFFISSTPLASFFCFLTDFLIVVVYFAFSNQDMDRQWRRSQEINRYLFCWLVAVLHCLLYFFFLTDNLLVFFLTFELSVLPVFAIVGLFGKRSQKFKAMKYLLYFTLFSGAPLLYNVAYLQFTLGTLHFAALEVLFPALLADHSLIFALVAFAGFFVPFAVKLACFPFHSWLPEAHVEASTEGSMLLSGVMLKLGFYGIIRCNMSLFPALYQWLAPLIATLGFLGALLAALVMYHQTDIKKVIAYSSVVHMNLAIIGFVVFSPTAFEAALLMNFSHGLISAGLFYAVGLLQDRTRSRNLLELSGLWTVMPRWCFCFFVLLLGNAGMPGTLGFVAEFSLICGILEHFPLLGLLLLLPLGLAALRNFILFSQLALGVCTLPSVYRLVR